MSSKKAPRSPVRLFEPHSRASQAPMGGSVLRIRTLSLRASGRALGGNWGRIFLPGLTVNACSLGGFISQSSVVDPFAAAMNALWTSYHSSPGILLGVSSIKFQAFLTLDSLVVDNIWDVQRRRRLKHPTYEKTYV